MPFIPFQILPEQLQFSAIRAQGPGGQNVNKVSSAVHLRFSVSDSTLPDTLKERLLLGKDPRITAKGEIIIKAQRFRTQEQNREDALEKLITLIRQVSFTPKTRKPTKATKASKERRLAQKGRKGELKRQRQIRE